MKIKESITLNPEEIEEILQMGLNYDFGVLKDGTGRRIGAREAKVLGKKLMRELPKGQPLNFKNVDRCNFFPKAQTAAFRSNVSVGWYAEFEKEIPMKLGDE